MDSEFNASGIEFGPVSCSCCCCRMESASLAENITFSSCAAHLASTGSTAKKLSFEFESSTVESESQ